MRNLFFDLLRASIGIQSNLNRIPSFDEWSDLYNQAAKQSLVGVCFVGLQHLGADADVGFERIGMSEDQYLNWMSMAAQIYQNNVLVNERCIEIQSSLAADGLKSCILKGQGLAALYGELGHFRQSGDIDVWVDAPKERVVALAKKYGNKEPVGYLHVYSRFFKDVSVELHYRPTYIRSVKRNRRIQKFCDGYKGFYKFTEVSGMLVPSYEFNVVYLLSHMFRHLFGSGIGLRQLMDYYFVLRSKGSDIVCHKEILKSMGLYKFAGAVMYVMRNVFNLEEEYLICPVDVKRGIALLDRIMQTGNFGNLDDEQNTARSTSLGLFRYKISQWWDLLRFYPEETLSDPLWRIIKKRSN